MPQGGAVTPEGRVAVVTGAAGSIGGHLLTRFEEAGYAASGIDLPSAVSPTDDRMHACDITDEASVSATFAQVLDRHGRIDVLVNNAGTTAIGRFDDHDLATHRSVMAVNHFGALACTQAALPSLTEHGGRVVVIGSVAGFAPVVGRPAYVASKHAVTGLFEALRPELAASGVGVTLVHPTFVTTGPGEAADRTPGTTRSVTGQRVRPDDVARAVVDAVLAGRDRVLVGRTAWLSWHLHRLTPASYVRLMTRRLGAR